MTDIVERLRFDATRCELQFSKGVASNIDEAADEIERLHIHKRKQAEDIMTLDQEIGGLMAEIERLQIQVGIKYSEGYDNGAAEMHLDLKGRDAVCDSYAEENQKFADEVERLRAENAAHRAILRRCREYVQLPTLDNFQRMSEGLADIEAINAIDEPKLLDTAAGGNPHP